MNLIERGPDSPTGLLASQCANLVQMTAMRSGPRSPNDLAFTALCGIGGIISVLATIVAPKVPVEDGKKVDLTNSVTEQTVQFAALLATATMEAYRKDTVDHLQPSHDVAVRFGPAEIIKAMEMYEKLTGEKPDAHLDPNMVRMAREFEAEANEPLNRLLSEIGSKGRTLN